MKNENKEEFSAEEIYFDSLDAPDDKKEWLYETYKEHNSRDKGPFEHKVSKFFEANGIVYLFKCPFYFNNLKRSYFVDFYLPDYGLIMDISPNRSSRFFDENKYEIRKIDLKSIPGINYHEIKRKDLFRDDFRCKISGALLSNYSLKKNKPRNKK